MKHKGIEFEIKIRPGNNEWSWTIKPALLAWHSGEVRGSRQFAETAAKLVIERWLRRNRGSRPDAVGEQKPRAIARGFPHGEVPHHQVAAAVVTWLDSRGTNHSIF